MDYINLELLLDKKEALKNEWGNKKPFKYIVFDDFFHADRAEEIYQSYPAVTNARWENTTYINQKNKFVKTTFEDIPLFQKVFDELNSPALMETLGEITQINPLLPDTKLFGAGLHQSIKGAFLDVHVDFNIHPETKAHRRMNLLVYMNKDWKKEYNGFLELWDMDKKKQLEYVAPSFNRCVIFETNEISFHGHPKPLNTPQGVSRKSLSVYYYTKDRDEAEIVDEHNTIYANTQGLGGVLKNVKSGIKAAVERLKNK